MVTGVKLALFGLLAPALLGDTHAVLAVEAPGAQASAAQSAGEWVPAWGLASINLEPVTIPIAGQTVRGFPRLSLGGERLRIQLSNARGTTSVLFGGVHVARIAETSTVVPGSDRLLTFGGATRVRLGPGAVLISDPVQMRTQALESIALSVYLPESVGVITALPVYAGVQLSTNGDHSTDSSFPRTQGKLMPSLPDWMPTPMPYLAAVEVELTRTAPGVICFGDSITAGPYPSFLAERLQAGGGMSLAVTNEGIGGNRILHDSPRQFGMSFGPAGVTRFQAALQAHPGARAVIVLEGINDILHPGLSAPIEESVKPADLIGGLERYIDLAHQAGVKIIGGTIAPFGGCCLHESEPPDDWGTREVVRQSVNWWIRSHKALDGVIDFDRVLRDPSHPERLRPAYDSGDHLHPNTAGYHAMADAIDLRLVQ
jgi:lysophospholipase L1-like esterase